MGTFGFLDSAGVGSDAPSRAPQRQRTTVAKGETSRRRVVGRMKIDPSVNEAAIAILGPLILAMSTRVTREKSLF